MIHSILFIFFLFLAPLQAKIPEFWLVPDAKKYPHIPSAEWKVVQPYLIPLNHPIKKKLDKLFEKPIQTSIESLQEAGFEVICYRGGKQPAVVKHPKLKPYILKMPLKKHTHELCHNFVRRAKGARFIQDILDKNNLNDYFKVPKKWIYPIRLNHSPTPDHPSNNFILVVEDMDLMTDEDSRFYYKNMISYHLLNKLFEALHKTGYNDCNINNVPFCKDGKIAFIDLDHYGLKKVNFDKLTGYFSSENQEHWEKFIELHSFQENKTP